MCLLVVQKENARMSNKQISNAWKRNSDGAGYSFALNNEIVTKKYMDKISFINNFTTDWNNNKNKVFIIHFRLATHGLTNLDNVHPFKVNKNLVFAHNGVINCVDDNHKLSDTQMYNIQVLKNLQANFLNNNAIRKLISESIGNSKLAFLDNKGDYTIINSEFGKWDKNKSIWFSNDSHKTQKSIFVNGGSYNRQSFAFDEWLECDWCGCMTDKTINYFQSEICEFCHEFQEYNHVN